MFGEAASVPSRCLPHPNSHTTVLPVTIQGTQRYLGSGLVKGIGPVFAEQIVAHFGLDTLTVIEEARAMSRRSGGRIRLGGAVLGKYDDFNSDRVTDVHGVVAPAAVFRCVHR